jgi:hypothetical protein
LARGAGLVLQTLNKFETNLSHVDIILGDTRHQLLTHTCHAIITSPPYINVFNYHQNYRTIMEHLEWEPLSCAVAEIGANRKNRQNRFLTVIQYCIDMALMFRAASHSLIDNGVFVIVLGRESNVLGTAFYNASIVNDLISALNLFCVTSKHERVFKNRFGASIYEDIYVLKLNNKQIPSDAHDIDIARQIGIDTLKAAIDRAPKNVVSLIEDAIAAGTKVYPSIYPKLSLSPLWPNL